jgi:hypothetical protein
MTEGNPTGPMPGQIQPEVAEDAALGQQQQLRTPAGVRKRIDELTKLRYDAERQADAERAERQRLTQEIAELRGQIAQATGATKPKGWDDLDADSTHKMLADEFDRLAHPSKNEETGEITTGDPNLLAKAIRELVRKEAAALVDKEKRAYAQVTEANNNIAATRAAIIRDFGADASNPQSDLRQRAEQHWGALEKKYGKDGLGKRLAETPDLEYLCFSKAASELYAEGKAQSPQAARELEVLRRQAGVGAGGEGVAEAHTRFSNLLKGGNLDSAAQELARQMMGGPSLP